MTSRSNSLAVQVAAGSPRIHSHGAVMRPIEIYRPGSRTLGGVSEQRRTGSFPPTEVNRGGGSELSKQAAVIQAERVAGLIAVHLNAQLEDMEGEPRPGDVGGKMEVVELALISRLDDF